MDGIDIFTYLFNTVIVICIIVLCLCKITKCRCSSKEMLEDTLQTNYHSSDMVDLSANPQLNETVTKTVNVVTLSDLERGYPYLDENKREV